jgi:predicted amidohydrolase
MRLCAIQFRADKPDWRASADRLAALVRQAGACDLMVCPEMALTGYLFDSPESALAVAEPCGGRTFQLLAPLAREAGSWLVAGYPEQAPEGLYNSAVVINPQGELAANYRKRLLFDCDEWWAQPGGLPYPLIPTAHGVLSVGICMDLNDPRFLRFLRREQPGLLAFPTNWLDQGFDILPYWQWRLRGVSSLVVAANTHGSEPWRPLAGGVPFRGQSAIFRATGPPLASAPRVGDCCLQGHFTLHQPDSR